MASLKPTYESLVDRIGHLEMIVQECERLSVANRYAAAVMHEVNNPLEAITNLAYLIEQEPLSKTAYSHLRLLQEQLTVLTAVTRPSLAFYRDKKVANAVDVVALIDSVNKLHAGRLQALGIKLHQHCPKACMCDVVASELLQVLSNLVLNAAEALEEAGSGSHIHIRVRACTGCISVLVVDDGPGVPLAVQQNLFQAHATGKKQGSGLGLWISQRIIENHRGSIHYRTSLTPGRSGTAFRISLPCSILQ